MPNLRAPAPKVDNQMVFADSHYLQRLHEAKQGYFHDYNEARSARGGKLWIAPNVLIREDVCTFHRPLVSSRSLILTGK